MAQKNLLTLIGRLKYSSAVVHQPVLAAGYSCFRALATQNQFVLHRRAFSQTCRYLSPQQSNQATPPVSGPKILSTLFPQTAVDAKDEEAAQEEKKREEEEKKNNEKAQKRMRIGFYVVGIVGGMMACWTVYDFGAPEVDSDGNVIEDEFSQMPAVQQYVKRMWKSMTYYQKMIQEPSAQKLLPDPLQYPYIQPKYTLILEVKGLLVHPDWTYQTGWRFKKRPGVNQFLEQMAKYYEIVVYTADQGYFIFPIIDGLDPKNFITYRLVRDATHFVDGHHVKNLDNLNRDLSKVIVVDWNPESVKLHPDNAFILQEWDGNDADTTMLDLMALLTTIATSDIDDVREVLRNYRQYDDPIQKFKENLAKLQELQKKQQEEKAKAVSPASKWSPGLFGRKLN